MPPKNKKSVTKKKPETKSLEMPSIFQKINRTSRIFAPVSNNINLLEDIEVKMKKYKEAIKNNNDKPLDTDYMNPALLNCLDSVVKQVKIIENPHIKNSQIKHIHDWYLEKLEKYNSIKKINSRTKKFDWEYIKDKTDLKSNYFEAYNVPKEFQRENRTEDISVLPPKDRLKDFKRKEVDAFIEKKQIDKDMSEMEDKKARLISATGSNFRSTMYTSKQIELNSGLNSLNQTASTFGFSTTGKTFYIQDCNLPTKNLENHIKKEIKSNYSFLRPTYKDSNIINEQKFLIEKNKELAYKRNFEEGRQFIDSWGRARSQFKSTLNFKLELNKLNEKYEKEMKEEKALKDKVEILSDLKNKKISVIGNDNYSAKDEEINDKSLIINSNQLEDQQNEESSKNNKMLIKVNNKNPISSEELVKKDVKTAKEIFKSVLKLKPIVIEDKAEVLNKLKTNNEDNFPSEAVNLMRHLDPVYSVRKNFGNFLNIKTIDNSKDAYMNHYNPLSFFDLKNRNKFVPESNNGKTNYKVKFRPTTGAELLRSKKFNSQNLLESRETLTGFNKNACDEIYTYNKLKGNETISLVDLNNSLILPDKKTAYERFYLPDPIFSSIDRPVENVEKKKKGKN